MTAKILIADDETDILSMLCSFFESKGYIVLPALNGDEALKQTEDQPDIILLDINMPGMSGLEVCGRIREHVSCPILFLTARIEDADKVKGFAVGGDDYIVKPFSLVELDARAPAEYPSLINSRVSKIRRYKGVETLPWSTTNTFPS